jgi:Flp pilus assembly CpaF family ATPase
LFRLELLARQSMRDLTLADLRSYIERVFDLVVVLRRLRTGRRIVRQIVALDGLAPDGAYRLADVFHASRVDGPDDVGWVADPEWRPSSRLAARMELEA